MFESLHALFHAANDLSPLAIIGLLVGLLYLVLCKQHPMTAAINENIQTIRENDLHPLADVAETLRRVEISQEKNFALILERLKGE